MEQWDPMLTQIAAHQCRALTLIADQNSALCAIAAAINELQASLHVAGSIQPLELVPLALNAQPTAAPRKAAEGKGKKDLSFKSLLAVGENIFTNLDLHLALENLNSCDRFDTLDAEVFYAVMPLLVFWLGEPRRFSHAFTLVNEGFLRFGGAGGSSERQHRKLWRSVLVKLENALDGGTVGDQLLAGNAHQLILHLRQRLIS